MRLTITTNFPEVQRAIDQLRTDIGDKVTSRALNRTIEQARTQMVREIKSTYAVTAAYVRERLRIKRATFRAGRLGLSAELIGGDGRRRAANVIRFTARQGLKGVTVKIRRDKPRKTIVGSFIANKGRTVFRRTSPKRLPIEPVQTIDIPQMFNARRINRAVTSAINGKFPAIFKREMQYALSRFAK
jgi:hypothetical protein